MPHDVTLIATIALAFVLAFVFGFIANGFRLPPLVGYLVAGVCIGPFTPGFVADAQLAGPAFRPRTARRRQLPSRPPDPARSGTIPYEQNPKSP